MIGERWRWWTVAFLAGCLFLGMVRSARAEDSPLLQVHSLTGQFKQTITDADGNALSASKGSFALLKPHFVRWEIEAPGRQLLLSDGDYLWQHDLDLETVNREPIDASRRSPLRLLMDSEATLELDYVIERDGAVVTLTPRDQDPLFQRLAVHMDGAVPTRLELLDTVEQTVVIELQVDTDVSLSPNDFVFSPPEGFDGPWLDTQPTDGP